LQRQGARDGAAPIGDEWCFFGISNVGLMPERRSLVRDGLLTNICSWRWQIQAHFDVSGALN